MTTPRGEVSSRWRFLPSTGVLVTVALMAMGIVLVGLDDTVFVVGVILTLVFFAYFLRHLAFAIAALRWAEGDIRIGVTAPLPAGDLPAISVLVAGRNEEPVIEELAKALLALDYPAELTQLIVVDDGSDDATGEILDQLSARNPRLEVIHRPPDAEGGKSGALNEAVERVTGEIVVVFDADHQPMTDVLRRLARSFADPSVALAQGRCIVRNHEMTRLAKTIAVDFSAGYMVNEYGRQAVYELPAYGGANCAVRTEVLRRLGGWNENSVTEDTDLTLRVVLAGYRTRYDVTARDTEEAVFSLERFWKQRYRWARGHQQCFRDYWLDVWRVPHLSLMERIETSMFLFSFHLPVLCVAGLGVIALVLAGYGQPQFDLLPLTVLMFTGPMLELGAGLTLVRALSRATRHLIWFLPLYFIFMAICTKAWWDLSTDTSYQWVKTDRAGTPEPSLAPAGLEK